MEGTTEQHARPIHVSAQAFIVSLHDVEEVAMQDQAFVPDMAHGDLDVLIGQDKAAIIHYLSQVQLLMLHAVEARPLHNQGQGMASQELLHRALRHLQLGRNCQLRGGHYAQGIHAGVRARCTHIRGLNQAGHAALKGRVLSLCGQCPLPPY